MFQGSINPAIAHYYNENSAIGVGSSYGYVRSPYVRNRKGDILGNHQFQVYPFWRRNYDLTEKTGMFYRLETGVGYSISHEYSNGSSPKFHTWTFDAGFRSGLYHFLTERLSFELMWGFFNYSHVISNYSYGTYHSDYVDLNLNLGSVTVGLQYYFLKE